MTPHISSKLQFPRVMWVWQRSSQQYGKTEGGTKEKHRPGKLLVIDLWLYI